jgi:dCTP deaminase
VRFTRIGDATHLDVKSPLDVTEAVDVGKGGLISVRPGEIVLGSSVESVGLGKNVAGLLQNRTSLSRLGLMVDASSGLLSPGSEGRLTLVIQNNFSLPIRIYAGMRIARISFVQMSSEVITAYGGRYQRQQEATASRIWEDFVK